ncbi:HMG box-containing protein 4-like isoform X2 [Physella acuta]|uniref:HMG box-containing protein 4-like isoform X2 n=1 Tax=Physella acuta TaxID=109671 RepID=UPI0027DB9C8C|nr:HMG box-containing protein 4-like isoform X2 [Physella acuta]
MSKREYESESEGVSMKLFKGDDGEQEESSASGRSGRVRKKSAKVLEMEEFEQVEKTQQVTKKGKTPKPKLTDSSEKVKTPTSSKKIKDGSKKLTATKIDTTPVSRPHVVTAPVQKKIQLKSDLGLSPTELLAATIKQEMSPTISQPVVIKTEDDKSVIKYLLSSPTSGSKISAHLSPPFSEEKKVIKQEKKKKETTGADTPGLKMKIFASSDPLTAQVSISTQPVKVKKRKEKAEKKLDVKEKPEKKAKFLLDTSHFSDDVKESEEEVTPPPAKKVKKKGLKKKEQLILEAISAAQQMPNLAALASPHAGQGTSSVSDKIKSPIRDTPSPTLDNSMDDEEEMNLIISETEEKKKKKHKKKSLIAKDRAESTSPKSDSADSKKRAPTAYMLFCNTHRPNIVLENPGIEFAGISRKLGEMWQTLSNKQKLQWRRKAQRRRKKGSNLISTGKVGKETGPLQTSTPSHKFSTLLVKTQRSSPEEIPLSPTKAGDQNLSIEPIDVAAHLKLLGESLSIIGMRLQEHKGMIAVQGSLSVLLDSLICACGPLLCLTQQVPGMDGCSPQVHSQTLDSVAYVMPGL